MAHANPEFALACRAHRDPPISHQTRKPASLAQLRARMRELEARIVHAPATVSAAEYAQLQLWRRVKRQDHRTPRLADALAEPRGGMHGGTRAGERFTEPRRRFPADVQAGRVKLDHRGLPA